MVYSKKYLFRLSIKKEKRQVHEELKKNYFKTILEMKILFYFHVFIFDAFII